MAILFKRAALAALLGIVAVAMAAWLLLRASLPALDGEQLVVGLDSRVTIARDDRGIPVIRAGTRSALAFGTGFAHAQDRFFQMDLLRRQAAGELSALVGPAALPVDRQQRLHRFRWRAGLALDRLPDWQRAILDAYVDGVNAGLESLGARPFEYFLLNAEPEAWHVEDTVLVGYAMFLELNDSTASRDVGRGIAREVLGDRLFGYLYPAGTDWDAPVQGSTSDLPEMPSAEEIDLRDRQIVFDPGPIEPVDGGSMVGSNNWAVSGDLTRSGRALVANDMHLGISTPNIWYRARLVQTGDAPRDASGVTLPGTPVIVTGSNGRVAWAFTNSYGDWTDAVLLKPGRAPGTYLTPDGEKAFASRTETIEVRGGEPETLVVRETIWGPVRPDSAYPGGDIAISWTAHHVEAVNFAHLALETVGSVGEAMAVANSMGIPPQNFVTGDADGNIAWTIAGRIPRRGAAAASRPDDWSTGNGWHGWYAPEDYPRIVNPDGGRIWTANARVVTGDALDVIGDGGYDLGARARQIRDDLYANDSFDVSDMLEIHLDDRAVFLERWRTLLLDLLDEQALDNRPGRQLYRALVQDWIPRASADSVGYRLVRGFRSGVQDRVYRMLVAAPIAERYGDDAILRISNQLEGPLWQLVAERPAHLLPGNVPSWEALMLDVVDSNVDYFRDNFDGDLADRTWGERNTAAFQHPLSRALPILSAVLDMPADALPGDSHMPRVQGPSFGASERFAVSPGAERDGYLHMPAGQSGHPLSAYYSKGHDDWVEGRAAAFLPGETVHTLELLPAD